MNLLSLIKGSSQKFEIAKAVFDTPTTRALIERLKVDGRLRRLCGWIYSGHKCRSLIAIFRTTSRL